MNRHSSGRAQVALTADERANAHLQLTAAERKQVRQLLHNMDEEKRRKAERAILHYRACERRRMRRRETAAVRSELRRLLKLSRGLREGLASTFGDADIGAALLFDRSTSGETPQESQVAVRTVTQAQLLATIADLDRLIGVLALAGKRVPDRKPGASGRAGNVYVLIEGLSDSVVPSRSGKRNSNQETIERLCRIADPDVTKASVEEAIKKWQAVRRARGEKRSRHGSAISPKLFRDKTTPAAQK
ncbi:hypothetical protein KUL72_06845 [Bradyrhizobium arachidis]|uniref:hypothetical protein n=1 Tax=Bradyrhizobium arachidis TaxID=858423 RepID=UPI0021619922|nr:hypothetical protein [Bradyrhizobium arachidis]UVO38089.1 hypothetical protein KUL72_06845 [Bradyrhizobium arachidis]